ncbi:MAG: hypothetical protein LQ346_003825 [Caloplaca aetnensis]|nr:MAG: hypothetical protein LQ346_003825 [Caloplaca aetnensis]
MNWTAALALFALIVATSSYDLGANLDTPLKFIDPTYGKSADGKAACVRGRIAVKASAVNTNLLLKSPASQAELTQTTIDMIQAGSDWMLRVTSGGPKPVSGIFQIYGQLCWPNDDSAASQVKTLQFLSHGGTLDHTYWDFARGYSYVDAAAAAGYATFSYDRLGIGLSDHPDPNQVVQAALQVEIAHQLIQGLRDVRVQGRGIRKVVGVGHSAGSALTLGIVGRYPRDFDGLVLTGISTSLEGVGISQVAFNLLPAALDPSGRFKGLDYGYLTQAAVPQAFQFPFYRYPEYDPKTSSVKGTYLQPRAGHLIAQHYTAAQGFAHSLGFLKRSGL